MDDILNVFFHDYLRGILAIGILGGLFVSLMYAIKTSNNQVAIRIVFILGMISSAIVGYYFGAESVI